MSFNDSFGPYDNNYSNKEENKNNVSFEGNNINNNISFEGNDMKNDDVGLEENNNNNINANNISFEGNNEKNNISFDNMNINDNDNVNNNEEEKQNDIFNSVPMEIQNEENQDILYYENLLITENIKHNLYTIFNIIKKNISAYKIKFFYELKYRADYKYSKLVEAEMIFMSMKNKLKIFNNIEKNFRYKLLKESFINLKKYAKMIKYKDEQNKIKENEMKKKIKEVNEVLKKNENNLKDISDSVDKLKYNEKNLNNEINDLNKKYNKLNDKYSNLIQKTKSLKESIKKKMENFSLTLDKTIDPKIAELQNVIKSKEKEKEKNMNYFEDFYNKMNDLIGDYQTKYETLKSTLNTSGSANS